MPHLFSTIGAAGRHSRRDEIELVRKTRAGIGAEAQILVVPTGVLGRPGDSKQDFNTEYETLW
ncbi:MAG: hypothetical protein LAO21_10840 [Acidobacteriia bacterium]|nr:hypothetical protein [Terriglobia bacterium]